MMRWAAFIGLAFLSVGTAWAQNGGSEIVVPPAPTLTPEAPSAPPPVQPPPQQPPPGLVQTPLPPPAGDDTSSGDTAAPTPTPTTPAPAATQPPPPDVAPAQPNNWTQGTTAVLGVLNKVDGSTTQLSLPVGAQPQTTGDLSISAQACLTRPAGEIPDTAVFVTVTSTQQGSAPLYRGWMLLSAPGATFVGNAGQTFRVIGCS